MELSFKGELEVAKALKKGAKSNDWPGVEVVVCPSFPSLEAVSSELNKVDKVQVGAQHVHWEERGAWTGSVGVTQIAPFVKWCIVGHSEQRKLTGLTDEQINSTVNSLLQHGINPVVCIGETKEQRQADETVEVVTEKMQKLLSVINRSMLPKLVVTYEPIWAISANNPDVLPDPTDVAGTMLLMRKLVSAEFGGEAAERARILYGGSVGTDNVEEFMREPGVDGALVGSASIQPRKFLEIVEVVQGLRGN